MKTRSRVATEVALRCLLTGLLLVPFVTGSLAAGESLTLRLLDVSGEPGGRVAIVLRTYASRSVGQGQACFGADRQMFSVNGDTPLFAAIGRATVFSVENDASRRISLVQTPDGQELLLRFRSPSATINSIDGPVAVIYARLSDSVVPGDVYDLSVDLTDTFLIDELGNTIPIEGRGGELEIRQPGSPYNVSAGAEDTIPGQPALLSLQTQDLVGLSGGQVGFRFDPDIATGPPVVRIDERYGNATFTVDDAVPGLVVVTFESPDGSLNRVPGDIVEVFLPTSPDIPSGTMTPIELDPALTFLVDRAGDFLPLVLENEILEFE